MGKVQAIAEQIQELSVEEFTELREWFLEQDFGVRDEEAETQSISAEFEEIVSDALAQYDSAQARKT